ncbi:DUF4238 domain-containing protein [Pseudomonas protegens]|uniref:DUF4238 domain-containing protein n=1 Tax=Pseudomonas protegens TaxID=380021 RepID=UPI0037FE2846
MSQQHNDNHYVPQLYLKQWAIEGKVLAYRLLVQNPNVPQWKKYTPKGIAYYRHLYVYTYAKGETDEFERWLDSEFESPAKAAIERATTGQRLTPRDWELLIRYLAAQDVRTPARLREFLVYQQEHLPSQLDEVLPRTLKQLETQASLGLDIQVPTQQQLDSAPVKVTFEPHSDRPGGTIQAKTLIGRKLWVDATRYVLQNVMPELMKHKWTIFTAPGDFEWSTSDDPVIRLDTLSKPYNFKGRWGGESGIILLPLSPKHLLFTSFGQRMPPRGKKVSIEFAMQIEKIIVEHAYRYVFSTKKHDMRARRPRIECAESFKEEEAIWKNWHRDQSHAERQLL